MDVAKPWNIDLVLFYFVNLQVSVFLFSVFFYFLFSTKKMVLYIFIIPITDSKHLQ